MSVRKSLNNNHCELLLRQLNRFRQNEEYTDVVLICEEKSIAAHKNILAAASPYFGAMFGGNFPERAQREIQVHDMDSNCLQLIVDFIYTGCLDFNVDIAQQLLMTAAFLQLQSAVDLCSEFIVKQLDIENCLGIKMFADKQNLPFLLEAAKDFIITNFLKVAESEEFIEISEAELNAVLADDKLYVHSDDAVLRGLVRWAEHKPKERLTALPTLLNYMHPACVSPEVARSLPILKELPSSSKWLNRVLQSEGNIEWRIFLMDKMGRQPDLHCYDLDFKQTTTLQPLPHAAFAVSLSSRKNILFAQGGRVGRCMNTSFHYNIYHNAWYHLRSLIVERSHHRSLVVHESLFSMGGNTLQGATSTVECLNLGADKAFLIKNMLSPRTSMGAVMHENVLFVMGGETDRRSLSTVERYDPREGIWQNMPVMHGVDSYCTSAVVDDSIYCCEGLGSCMERFDLRANRWEIIDFLESREFFEIFAVNNRLFSISGEEISAYCVNSNEWHTVHTYPTSREWDTAIGVQMLTYSGE